MSVGLAEPLDIVTRMLEENQAWAKLVPMRPNHGIYWGAAEEIGTGGHITPASLPFVVLQYDGLSFTRFGQGEMQEMVGGGNIILVFKMEANCGDMRESMRNFMVEIGEVALELLGQMRTNKGNNLGYSSMSFDGMPYRQTLKNRDEEENDMWCWPLVIRYGQAGGE